MERRILIESAAPCVDGGRAELWRRVGASFLGACLDEMAASFLIPKERDETALLLEAALPMGREGG